MAVKAAVFSSTGLAKCTKNAPKRSQTNDFQCTEFRAEGFLQNEPDTLRGENPKSCAPELCSRDYSFPDTAAALYKDEYRNEDGLDESCDDDWDHIERVGSSVQSRSGLSSPAARAGILPGVLSQLCMSSDAGTCLDPADWVLFHQSTPRDSDRFHFTMHRLSIVRATRVEDDDE
jgi:hypothetical protein